MGLHTAVGEEKKRKNAESLEFAFFFFLLHILKCCWALNQFFFCYLIVLQKKYRRSCLPLFFFFIPFFSVLFTRHPMQISKKKKTYIKKIKKGVYSVTKVMLYYMNMNIYIYTHVCIILVCDISNEDSSKYIGLRFFLVRGVCCVVFFFQHAVIAASEALFLELGGEKSNVRVHCLCPGAVPTDLFDNSVQLT